MRNTTEYLKIDNFDGPELFLHPLFWTWGNVGINNIKVFLCKWWNLFFFAVKINGVVRPCPNASTSDLSTFETKEKKVDSSIKTSTRRRRYQRSKTSFLGCNIPKAAPLSSNVSEAHPALKGILKSAPTTEANFTAKKKTVSWSFIKPVNAISWKTKLILSKNRGEIPPATDAKSADKASGTARTGGPSGDNKTRLRKGFQEELRSTAILSLFLTLVRLIKACDVIGFLS